MTLLIPGVLLWIFVHFIPTAGRSLRQALIDKLGMNRYRGLFALVMLTALTLIIVGWRSTPESYLYVLPGWSRFLGFALMIASLIILGTAHYQSAIKRFVRHPMLTGVVLWAASHLLMNGTTRALVLFGGLGLWALLEMPLISAREGAYTKPDSPGFAAEIRGLLITTVIFVVVLFLHPYFAGVSPIVW